MKRIMNIVLALALSVCLAACAGAPSGGAAAEPTAAPSTLSGRIVEVSDGSLLVAPEAGGLYLAPLSGLEASGCAAPVPGRSVEIVYSGEAAETFPAQLVGVTSIDVTGDGADLAGLYLRVIDDLWRPGGALTDDIDVIAFDLSQALNLSRGEKDALEYLAAKKYGHEALEGTLDELRERGYIDKDELWFPRGVLIRFYDMSFKEDGFTFSAQLWRSGTGAMIITDARAWIATDGEWSYEAAGWAVS